MAVDAGHRHCGADGCGMLAGVETMIATRYVCQGRAPAIDHRPYSERTEQPKRGALVGLIVMMLVLLGAAKCMTGCQQQASTKITPATTTVTRDETRTTFRVDPAPIPEMRVKIHVYDKPPDVHLVSEPYVIIERPAVPVGPRDPADDARDSGG